MFFSEELVDDTKWLEIAFRVSWAAICFGNPFLWERLALLTFGQHLGGQKTKTKTKGVGTIEYSVPRKYLQNKISTSETETFTLKWVFIFLYQDQ